MQLEINSGRKIGKFTKIWKLNGTLLNNQWAKKEITRDIPLVKEKQKHNITKLMDCNKSAKKEIYNCKCIH